jgi:hypothetical protein
MPLSGCKDSNLFRDYLRRNAVERLIRPLSGKIWQKWAHQNFHQGLRLPSVLAAESCSDAGAAAVAAADELALLAGIS